MAARPQAAPLPLSGRLLTAGELRGFTPETAAYTTDPAKWPHSCAGGAGRVRRDGFVASAGEHLKSPLHGRDAVSFVARFRTSAGARADVAAFITHHSACSTVHFTRFMVATIPGATGLDAHQSDGEGYDVLFADGPFSYDVGTFTTDRAGPPTEADIKAAADRLWERVHGHPPVPRP